jgi:peroxiredoxin
LLVNWADVPVVASTANNFVAGFTQFTANEGMFAELAQSTDGGKSFTRLGPVHSDRSATEHSFMSLLASHDAIRAFWLDRRPGPAGDAGKSPDAMRLYTALVRGGAVVDEVLLDDRVCDCCGLASAMTSDGPIVAYRDRSEDEVRDISVVRFDGTSFARPERIHDDGFRIAGCPVNGPAMAAEGSRIALAWYTYAGDEGNVKLVFSSDAGKHFGSPVHVVKPSTTEAPLGRVGIVLLDNGEAIVSTIMAGREDARLVLRRAAPDGHMGAPLVVASMRADRTSGFPKMVRFGETLLVVWLEGSPLRLRASTWNISAVPAVSQQNDANDGGTSALQMVRPGDAPAAFEVTTLDGAKTSLETLRGKPALVNLWATYCEPCRQEIPVLADLHRRYASRGLQVVGVSMDREKQAADVRIFVQKRQIPHSVWLDPEDRAGRAFGVRVLPATFLLDAQGKVVWAHQGAVRENDPEIVRAIEAALAALPSK